MSNASRINHAVRALKQSGFYPENENSSPGEITPAVEKGFQEFLGCKDLGKGKIRPVINALRTIEPQTFRGLTKSCDVITDTVRTAVKNFLEAQLKKHSEVACL